MNKNIIKIGLLLSTSVMTEMALLTVPTIETYSDNLVQKIKACKGHASLTQLSQTQNSKHYTDASAAVLSQASGISVRTTLSVQLDDVAILSSVVERIQKSKSLPDEFANIIDDNFWDLI